MLYDPSGDLGRFPTGQLICTLIARADASSSLLAMLGLMVEVSSELSTGKQARMAASLRDAAELIEARMPVKCLNARLGLPPASHTDEGATP